MPRVVPQAKQIKRQIPRAKYRNMKIIEASDTRTVVQGVWTSAAPRCTRCPISAAANSSACSGRQSAEGPWSFESKPTLPRGDRKVDGASARKCVHSLRLPTFRRGAASLERYPHERLPEVVDHPNCQDRKTPDQVRLYVFLGRADQWYWGRRVRGVADSTVHPGITAAAGRRRAAGRELDRSGGATGHGLASSIPPVVNGCTPRWSRPPLILQSQVLRKALDGKTAWLLPLRQY